MPPTVGQRVRTLIDLESADWHPEQPDIPSGSLGTVVSIHYDQSTGRITSYAVMLDDSVDPLAVAMEPAEIEAHRVSILDRIADMIEHHIPDTDDIAEWASQDDTHRTGQ